MRHAVVGLVMTAALATAATSGLLDSAKGEFSVAFRDLTYDPTRACAKPYKPYDGDRVAIELYRNQVIQYAACLKSAATADMAYADGIVVEGYKKAIQQLQRDM